MANNKAFFCQDKHSVDGYDDKALRIGILTTFLFVVVFSRFGSLRVLPVCKFKKKTLKGMRFGINDDVISDNQEF